METTPKNTELNLVLVVVLVLKSKALYGSCSELQSKVLLREWERVNWNRGGAGGGEEKLEFKWSSCKAPLGNQKSCGCEGGQVPKNQ